MKIKTTESFHAQTGVSLPADKVFDAPDFAAKRWLASGAATEIAPSVPAKPQIERPTRKKREKAIR